MVKVKVPDDEDKPRPLAVGEDATADEKTEDLPELLFPFPLLFPPDLTSRSALAPKLIRRANGVVGVDMGVVLGASPSSTALSSMMLGEPEPDE